ncbi:MAG: hypothetical protein UT41_C0002G0006 [Candidatus Wolfebacteria bacterium GW2011_GWC2_39_22]|uniref:Uncharacterized protein n=1 Tax=Candidatus Wolfebacteria bacterium GW2011_GWC2_39_22 TaxID=1619013 RepID=A0A0G0RF08_9BACT|nr:MAG: hypothetical protein UT41_C0002G0006 [Candidatus Wolfebacteria bacterium GW2011_GWC2_39_22]HBI25867.1 hypothetical protein [Candidatus Wolfebacteria bacterium]
MAEKEKEKAKPATAPGKMESLGASLFKWGVAILILVGGYNIFFGDEAKPAAGSAATTASRQYVAAYDFSKVDGDFHKESFVIPAGDKWVSVALPADYHVAFTWNEGGAIDKGDGKGPRWFKKDEKFKSGTLGTAVDLTFPAGDTVEVRFYRHGKTQQPMAKRAPVNKEPAQRAKELAPVIVSGHEQG